MIDFDDPVDRAAALVAAHLLDWSNRSLEQTRRAMCAVFEHPPVFVRIGGTMLCARCSAVRHASATYASELSREFIERRIVYAQGECAGCEECRANVARLTETERLLTPLGKSDPEGGEL